jgi:peptidoglycan/LPS O-acetylase OafA/YrhL
VTIAVTCLLTYLILPSTRFAETAQDGLASALYFVNWRLAAQSVNYLAQGAGASPFQHF